MSLLKRLKPPKALRKLQPGKLIKGAVNAAAAIGIPGAGAAAAAANAIGKRVDAANRVIEKAKAEAQRVAKESGLSTTEAYGKLADTALAGAEAGLDAADASRNATPLLLIVGVAVVLLFLVHKGR